MKKPIKPDIKQQVLDEYIKLTERLEKKFKIHIRYNVESVKGVDKIHKIKRK